MNMFASLSLSTLFQRCISRFSIALVLLPLYQVSAYAQFGGGEIAVPTDAASVQIDAIHGQVVNAARSLGLPEAAGPEQPMDRSTYEKLEYPLRLTPQAKGNSTFHISNFVDLDESAGLQDFVCGSRTYNGHRGTDNFLSVGTWWRMDQGTHEIVAATDGTIVAKHDGENDRTCGQLSNVPNNPANYVTILQPDGLYAYYYHMKNGSVTPAAVGSTVKAGDYLGKVGSSGFSTGPHLHFELRTQAGQTVDPFFGSCTAAPSLWKHQWHAENDFRITEVSTHSAPPQFATCTNNVAGTDTTFYKSSFNAGETVYFIVYLRDLFTSGIDVSIEVLYPSGAQAWNRQFNTGSRSWASSYWYFWYTPSNGAPTGRWRYKITAGTQSAEGAFFVGATPENAELFAASLPGGRSIQTGTTATAFVSILNSSSNTAYGCGIYMQTPVAGEFWFQETNPSTNMLTGTRNMHVDIPAGAVQTFAVGYTPDVGTSSTGVTTSLRYKCANSDAAQVFKGVNTLTFSFDDNPVPDIIPIGVTPTQDGVLRTGGVNTPASWFAAAVNIGSSATLNVRSQLPQINGVSSAICELDTGGNCTGPTGSTISVQFQPNVPKTFKITVQSSTQVPFDPANNRSALRFEDAGGLRGETSVALTTE
ncbi:hypothetical protein CSC94_21885 [Zhengella mangrovi]|uniref:M23ase beta-sheet core domain-containing protein n=1 Tax=Zhengella mangrovi TaxID=1982044 RepID=A0A2G1QHJ0_9HYPH|nr:M23 family metallopeptidase [Zhengella mangrovi]PHP64986.1 hypothetical protein CSC94_21885 [Zhengella mangrovi]